MDTKTRMIETATKLFQQRGYKAVGLNELLRACETTKGALYHHFPGGKEELLIACLHSLNETLTRDIELLFNCESSTEAAVRAVIGEMIKDLDRDGTIAGYTFSSIVSEMSLLSEPARDACRALYEKIQSIFHAKLLEDGFSNNQASSVSLFLTASIEGGLLLCRAQNSSIPLKTISNVIPELMKEF
ncbi:TetR/AcrR family transcriptional regulator [Sporosarcina sp. BI001-red]|uniref:TetR/AcrR family transcriptional regulator n=1 Tax=Sporosarcina sp. BI001-red TaxID=2282866 RepID=UPI000E2545A6|nr:TetR/AcrR family transcriptional regulator [Sporosarcina sp. BI001-red]REB05550.1 TetR/AcrR family transcriptional regulator [Sporosarcina sp. BI001-red]